MCSSLSLPETTERLESFISFWLAAFDVDGNIRGIGVPINPPFGPYEGQIVYEMTLRSNNSGDTLSFQFYDSGEHCSCMYNISNFYTFIKYLST